GTGRKPALHPIHRQPTARHAGKRSGNVRGGHSVARRRGRAGLVHPGAPRHARRPVGGASVRIVKRKEPVVNTLLQDLKYGLRMLWRPRGLSAVIVLILAIGIGSSATLAGMVEALLIRYPYATSSRFDVVRGRLPKQNANIFLFSIPELRDLQGLSDVF